MLLKYGLEMFDLQLRSLSIGGEKLGIASEMFTKFGSGEWAFIARESGSKGIDALLFAEGTLLKGLDLKTGRFLSAKELLPYAELFEALGIKVNLEQVKVQPGQASERR
jgi:hypothetical protein